MLEDVPEVVPPPLDLEVSGGVGLAHLVPGDHLNLATLHALGDLQVPHTIKDKLPTAALKGDSLG